MPVIGPGGSGNPTVGARPSIADRWWVIIKLPGGSQKDATPTYSVVSSQTRPGRQAGSVAAGPFMSKNAADQWITSSTQGGTIPGGGVIADIGHALNPSTWLASIGGGIASGIESGFVNFFKDLWDVIIGPVEVILGVIILFMTLTLYFKNDVMALISIVSRGAS